MAVDHNEKIEIWDTRTKELKRSFPRRASLTFLFLLMTKP